MSTVKWKRGSISAIMKDGATQDFDDYYMKDGPFAVAKVGDKHWCIFVKNTGTRIPHRFNAKTPSQNAAIALLEAGQVDWELTTNEQICAAAGGAEALNNFITAVIEAA